MPEIAQKKGIIINSGAAHLTLLPVANGRPQFPINLFILFILFLTSVFIFMAHNYNMIYSSLPTSYQPLFTRVVEPFAIGQKSFKKIIPTSSRISSDHKKYVKIEGQFYEYNPSGVYNVNGKKVFLPAESK